MRSLLLVLVCAVLVAACGGNGDDAATSEPTAQPSRSAGKIQRDPANAKVALTIGSKNFTEQKVLGEIYAQGLEAAGYKISKHLDLGDQDMALAALEAGEVSAYPEYTGTALIAFFHERADAVPKDPQQAYEEVKRHFAAEGMAAFPPTPFTSSNEVAVTAVTAEKLGLRNISDLQGEAKKLVLAGAPECRERLDCLAGLEQVYGLSFKRFTPVKVGRRHEVLSSGRADVSIVFTTDPQIQREKEVLLEDDRGMFPPYNSTLVMKQATADAAGPDLPRVLQLIQEQLTDENMQELNARVDLDKKDPAEVAREYLIETGLIAEQ
jgi:osmoprotectant transport system substrate-binding protein